MAGANGLPKFELVDREGEVRNPKTQGTPFRNRQVFQVAALGATIFTGAQFVLNDITFLAAAPAGPYTGPTLADALNSVGQVFLNQPFVNWTTQIENQTALAIVINMTGAGWNPASLTIPANSIARFTFEIATVGLVPTSRLTSSSFSTPGVAPIPVSPPGTISFSRYRMAAQTVLPQSGAAGQVALIYVPGFFATNDPVSFPGITVGANGDLINIGVTGTYLFQVTLSQPLGQQSTWMFNGGSPIVINQFFNENFGNADTVATAPIGVQDISFGTCALVNAPNTLAIVNSSNPGANQTLVAKVASFAGAHSGNLYILRLA